MKLKRYPKGRRSAGFLVVCLGLGTCLSYLKPAEEVGSARLGSASVFTRVHAQEADGGANLLPEDAASAWEALSKALRPPVQPPEWNSKEPTRDEMMEFRAQMAEAAGKAADMAKEFYTRFPDHAKSEEAKNHERRMLAAAVTLGDRSREEALEKVGGPPQRPAPAAAQAPDELQSRMRDMAQKAVELQEQGMEAVFSAFEEGVRSLQKEFPDRPEIYQALLEIANGLSNERSVELAQEIIDAEAAPEFVKDSAKKLRDKIGRLGQPIEMSFTAIDGREVDLAGLQGKVVLIDFWATWCGPCIQELPNVKAAYKELNPKGFEIIGISFDEDKAALERLVKKEDMTWPQYFDGEGWSNKYGKEYGIQGIPAMWLIDKKGNLRDLNARSDLAKKVEALLAE